MVFVPTHIKHFACWLKRFIKKVKKNKPSGKELAQRSKQKHVRFATHASNFFPKASLHNVAL
jgi:hypothetical protein